jgi:hypothetical protein
LFLNPGMRGQETTMDKVQTKRGGDPDGPRSRPRDEHENKQEKLLGDELDDSFPASDPPASTQPTGKEPPPPKPRNRDR